MTLFLQQVFSIVQTYTLFVMAYVSFPVFSAKLPACVYFVIGVLCVCVHFRWSWQMWSLALPMLTFPHLLQIYLTLLHQSEQINVLGWCVRVCVCACMCEGLHVLHVCVCVLVLHVCVCLHVLHVCVCVHGPLMC